MGNHGDHLDKAIVVIIHHPSLIRASLKQLARSFSATISVTIPHRSLEYQGGKIFFFFKKNKCAAESIGLLVQDCSLEVKKKGGEREESSTFHSHRHQQHFSAFSSSLTSPLLSPRHILLAAPRVPFTFSHSLITKTKPKKRCPSSTST